MISPVDENRQRCDDDLPNKIEKLKKYICEEADKIMDEDNESVKAPINTRNAANKWTHFFSSIDDNQS